LTASGSVRNRVRRILLGWPLHAALSLALIFWLVSDLDWTTVKRTLLAADRLLVAAAFAVLAPIPLLAAERWRRASAALGIELSRRFFVRATYAALFAGQFLPAGVGPDAVRFTLLWRQRVVLGGAIQSIAIDRICGVGALLVLVYAGLPFTMDLLPAGSTLAIAAASALLVVGFGTLWLVDRWPLPAARRRGRLGRILSLISEGRAAIVSRHTAIALAFAVSLHLLAILAVTVLARAFGYELRFRELVTVTAAAILVSMLPISFNGWGLREGAMMLGLSLLAVPRDVALMISLLYGVGSALWSLPGSLLWRRLAIARGA